MKKSFDYSTIAALEPVYGENGGNLCRVYTNGGEVFVLNRKVETFLRGIVESYNSSLKVMRENNKRILHCDHFVPLAVAPRLVLVPVKMRRPLGHNDGATGYINNSSLLKVTDNKKDEENSLPSCRIFLEGGHVLTCLLDRKVVQQRRVQAQMMREELRRLQEDSFTSKAEALLKEYGVHTDRLKLIEELYRLILDPPPRS